MPTLICYFNLDVNMAKSIMSIPQFIMFKIKGMQILHILERQMRKADNKTTREQYGFSSMAEGSEEDCKKGYDEIMDLLADNKISDELKCNLNGRDMKFFKKMFYKGIEKIGKENSFLNILNSYGILADIKII